MLDVPGRAARTLAAELETRCGTLPPAEILALMCRETFAGRIAMVSSFGADSVALLHMLAQVAPEVPVLFLETGMHFSATLEYRRALSARLGLTNVVDVRPDPQEIAAQDAQGQRHRYDPDGCCALRKVRPLARALEPYAAWINGRRRDQTLSRRTLPVVEADAERVKVNPLAGWDQATLEAYIDAHKLPRHPLVADGYRSIGCAVCTARPGPGEDSRAGRWRGFEKTECGIHAVR